MLFGSPPSSGVRHASPALKAALRLVTALGSVLPGAQSPFHGLSQLAQRLPILHRQLYNKSALVPLPAVACEAASKTITIMIYPYKRRTAAVARTWHASLVTVADETFLSLIESRNSLVR
jgi:hypothetical protein